MLGPMIFGMYVMGWLVYSYMLYRNHLQLFTRIDALMLGPDIFKGIFVWWMFSPWMLIVINESFKSGIDPKLDIEPSDNEHI